MNSFIFATIVIIITPAVQAQSLEGRQYVADQIMQVKKQACGKESSKIKAELELAATMIIHGERSEMTTALNKAKSESKIKNCKEKIKELLK